MPPVYNRDYLVNVIATKHSGSRWVILEEQPKGKYVKCAHCSHVTVRVYWERFGDGTDDHINWMADTWSGKCQRKECGYLNLWIELADHDVLDRENRRLLIAACDRELKSL
jgi:hypothetical protein